MCVRISPLSLVTITIAAKLAASVLAIAHEPAIKLTDVPRRVEVVGLTTDQLAAVDQAVAGGRRWSKILTVRIAPAKGQPPAAPMWGAHAVEDDRLVFRPRFAFQPGHTYLAEFSLPAPATRVNAKRLIAELLVPTATPSPPPKVASIAPSSGKLPENLLKFYIEFSQPMARGEAYEHLELVDSHGREVPDAFLELGEELWDPAGRRFTLLFDPGRIKRGVKPNQDMGAALVPGRSYTLVVKAGWRAASGLGFAQDFKRQFEVGPADRDRPRMDQWKLHSPNAATRQPLVVDFDEPLDAAMLADSLGVVDSEGTALVGDISIDAQEARWQFTPSEPWQRGAYRLIAANTLEDLAGNSLGRAFEERVEGAEPKTADRETYEREFRVSE